MSKVEAPIVRHNFAAKPAQKLAQEQALNRIESKPLFGEDGFGFDDFLDIINPLQHIPVVSTIYRALTGDQIETGARFVGSGVFGGPIGLASAFVNEAVETSTGKDLGDHVLALFTDEKNAPPETALAENAPATPVPDFLVAEATVDSKRQVEMALLAAKNQALQSNLGNIQASLDPTATEAPLQDTLPLESAPGLDSFAARMDTALQKYELMMKEQYRPATFQNDI